ncbi:MAG TPA: DUF1080 domain-containing protein [Gemmataceae bacterium]|jgi:hypothetical protein
MRLTCLLFAAAVLGVAGRTARADDTADFLNPDNWEGRTDIWTIKDGVVVGETKQDPKYNNFFCSKKKYGDFELSCKLQLRDGKGNSGIQIRSERFDKPSPDNKQPFRVRGPQVDAGAGYWGSLYGEGVGGMMKQSSGEAIKTAVKPTDFNEYYVLAKGDHITIKINGETMVDQDFPTLPGKGAKPLPKEGIIAFQAHAGFPAMRVEFKDIKFKNLSK